MAENTNTLPAADAQVGTKRRLEIMSPSDLKKYRTDLATERINKFKEDVNKIMDAIETKFKSCAKSCNCADCCKCGIQIKHAMTLSLNFTSNEERKATEIINEALPDGYKVCGILSVYETGFDIRILVN
jgi:hypothetical protein